MYAEQRRQVTARPLKLLPRVTKDAIEVSTVDGFQGREKRTVILDVGFWYHEQSIAATVAVAVSFQ